jgi:hypothetical protein
MPGMSYFTPDGRYLLVTNLFWGDDVERTFGGSQQGMLTTIRFKAQSRPDQEPRHTIVSTAATGGSPENFAISPGGEWVVSLDLEQSYFPRRIPAVYALQRFEPLPAKPGDGPAYAGGPVLF